MAYHKHTFATGNRADGSIHVVQRSGHWKSDTIRRAAKREGLIGQIKVSHWIGDSSGKGRSGNDREFTIII